MRGCCLEMSPLSFLLPLATFAAILPPPPYVVCNITGPIACDSLELLAP